MIMEKKLWLKIQWLFARFLFKIRFINRILWDSRWRNKVFMWREKLKY